MKKALICTVLNEESTIVRFLDSIAGQTQLPDEIIIVDGGSKDKTLNIILSHKINKKRKINVITKRGNRSIGRNYALQRTKSSIAAITDAGCILDKNWFKRITEPFQNKKIDVVSGYYKAKAKSIFQKCLVPYVLVMPDKVDPNNFLPATRSMAIRKNIWQQVGKFDEILSNNEDYDFARRLKKRDIHIKFVKNAIVYWIPRTNWNQAFIMFYRFAKGDVEAKIYRPKVIFLFSRYLLAIFLFLTENFILLGILIMLYFMWAVWKNYSYIKKPQAIFYLPFIQLLADIAVLSGSSTVLLIRYLPLISLLVFLMLVFSNINLPYVGQNAYNNITYSLIAHNYNQFGYFATKFAPVVSVSQKLIQNPEYFIHHPPLLSVAEALFLKLFGEDFWVGRFFIITFTLGVVVLIYLIEKNLTNKKKAFLALGTICLFPATSIFGKMIGQEQMVLVFILGSVYFVIKYLKENKVLFYVLATILVILATLSDWPAIIFYFTFILFFLFKKRLKQGLLLFLISFVTAAVTVGWIAWIRSGLWDLNNAVGSRLFTAISDVPFWPVIWVGTIFFRLIIYYNPIFCLFALIAIVSLVKSVLKKKLSDHDVITLTFGLFAIIYMALYIEATFSHPYLIIYWIPFFTFLTSSIIYKMVVNRSYALISFIFVLSLAFLLIVSYSKDEQIKSNIWRYNLAYSIKSYLNDYQTIIFNTNYVIDHDIWRYPLLINPKLQDKNDSSEYLKNYDYYVYSCSPSCDIYGGQIGSLKKRYQYRIFRTKEAEAYLFFLKKKQENLINNENDITFVDSPSKEKNFIINAYRKIRDILGVYQI